MPILRSSGAPAPGAVARHAQSLLIDEVLPTFDATRAEHRIIEGDLATVWRAVLEADMARTGRENAVVRTLFALRALGERLAGALRRQPPAPPAEVSSMRLADLPSVGEWVLLEAREPSEVVFGAIGRFWAGETTWETIDAGDFIGFDRPGLARIAANFSLRPYGEDRVLVTYECRTQATDAEARRAFLRYWRALSPFIGMVLRAQLAAVASTARELAPSSPAPSGATGIEHPPTPVT